MDERTSRIFFGLCMLVLVWIGVYWMWQPSREQEPTITFDPGVGSGVEDQHPEIHEEILGSSGGSVANLASEAPSIAVPSPDEPTLVAPEFTRHVVAPNEMMQTIAKLYYGSIDDWTIIAKANPTIDPKKLKPGMILRIPKDRDNIQGKLVGDQTPPGVIFSHKEHPSKTIEYVVRSGDSLSAISQRIYGSSRHARFIYESNRDILRSMDAISVGQLLKLPPLPDEASKNESNSGG